MLPTVSGTAPPYTVSAAEPVKYGHYSERLPKHQSYFPHWTMAPQSIDSDLPEKRRYGQIRVRRRLRHRSCRPAHCLCSLNLGQTTTHLLDTWCRCESLHRMDPRDCVPRSQQRLRHLAEK